MDLKAIRNSTVRTRWATSRIRREEGSSCCASFMDIPNSRVSKWSMELINPHLEVLYFPGSSGRSTWSKLNQKTMRAVNMAYYYPIHCDPTYQEEVQTSRRPTVRLVECLRCWRYLLCCEGIHNTILWYQTHWEAYSLYRRQRQEIGQT